MRAAEIREAANDAAHRLGAQVLSVDCRSLLVFVRSRSGRVVRVPAWKGVTPAQLHHEMKCAVQSGTDLRNVKGSIYYESA